MLKKKFKVFLILLFLISTNTYAERIEGIALVIDGDTIKIKNNKIRLSGIDAPESNQLCKRIFLSIQFNSKESIEEQSPKYEQSTIIQKVQAIQPKLVLMVKNLKPASTKVIRFQKLLPLPKTET